MMEKTNRPARGWSAEALGVGGKVLIISYLFPPIGGGGAIRLAKFVKFLPLFDWQPAVLTVKNGFHPFFDTTLLQEIPQTVKITRVKYFEPIFWLAWSVWRSFLIFFLYPWLLIPDRQILWLPRAIIIAKKIIKKEKIGLIFTSSAPASDHLIGLILKRLTGVKWVADFRDEWTNNPLKKFPTPLHRFLNQFLEKKVIQQADLVISVAPSLTAYLKNLTPAQRKFLTITNGFDSEDFSQIPPAKTKKYCQLIYTGSLYDLHLRDIFLEALGELKLKNLKIDFIGVDKRISHRQAVASLNRADILLLILDPTPRPAVFTGKLYEYLAARKPILALAPKNSGAARLITRLKVGEVADPQNLDEIKQKLQKYYQKWLKNELKIPQVNITSYERKNLTQKLANKFNNLTKKSPKKIRLCLIGNISSPQNQSLVRYFKNIHYDVYFISTRPPSLRSGVSGRAKPGSMAGIKNYYLGPIIANPCSTACYFLRSLWRIRWLIKKIKPDIVHGQDLVFAGIWAYLSGFHPIAVTPWGSDVMNYEKFVPIEKYLIKKTLQNADLVTVSSEALQKQAEKIGMGKDTAQMVHFGIDLNIFSAKSHSADSGIIFSPRAIAPIYNIDILIKAFALVAKRNKNITLSLLDNVADENYLIEIEKLIIKLDLVDKVSFWPKVPNQKMTAYYNKAEVIVSISSSDGCSVSFLEAMATESKIVATDLPYIKEYYQNKNIWRVPVRNVPETAKAILTALKFPSTKWQKIGAVNRQLIAEKAEINKNFEKLDKLYKTLI